LSFKFTQTLVEMKDKRVSSVSVRKFDLEEEHKKMMKSLESDLNDFKLSRIPRPEDKDEPKKK